MTQKGSNRKKKAPAYSQDTMALRLMAGLGLMALGIVMFLAVDLRMQGNVFQGLRAICLGLCGSLALVLPVLPIWAGVLVIWSTQKKAPARPWAFTSLCFIGICAFVMLISPGAMEHLTRQYGPSWGSVITGGFNDCAQTGTGGGAVGIALAWPLWRFLGSFLGAVIVFLLSVFCLLLAVNLTPEKIKAIVTGQAGRLREQQQAQRRQNEEQQLAWQQQQAAAQQAWQQQQQAILEQQAQRMAGTAQQTGAPFMGGQQPFQAQESEYAGGNAGASWSQQQPGTNSVEEWQEQMTARQVARTAPEYQSVILNRKDRPKEAQPEKSTWRSRIFNRKDSEDGLTDPAGNTAQTDRRSGRLDAGHRTAGGNGRYDTDVRRAGEMERPEEDLRRIGQQQESNEDVRTAENSGRMRMTATGERVRQPETHWSTVTQEAGALAKEAWNRKTAKDRKTGAGETDFPGDDPVSGRKQTADRPGGTNTDVEMPGQPGSRQADRRESERPEAGTEMQNRESDGTEQMDWRSQAPVARDGRQPEKRQTPVPVPKTEDIGRTAYKPELKLPPKAEEEADGDGWMPTTYYVPPITDLKMPTRTMEDTGAEDAMRSRRLEETLASFKVQARVVNVTHGPAISRFELELAAGTKVNKVSELEKDIAYGMEATSVRIEAPIPGKSLVGVEVPNRKVATVTLREVLESEKMQASKAKSVLTVALGKDIAGTPIVCDLAKMPHMLIAGQTGSGKSVCINAIINSLLYNEAGPDQIKLILVDPKVVELQCYNEIPHLLIPVVNDPHKAAAALAWAVAEMMDRYDKFAQRKVRNLDGYNSVIGPGEKPMARIVIIIDELADLMMVCKKDVEEYICRLTQLARAAGIHLIVATQRPSVDVITGLIKANIPSRIAFKTASYVDSRTILDRNGSEQLLGWGDMLYLPTGSFAPTRVQGCFLSDDEVNQVVRDVKMNNPCAYDQDILDKLEQFSSGSGTDAPGMDMIGGTGGESGGADSNLFEQAVEYAIQDGQISTSTLQRRLKIGYARAGRLTDEMEERGIVAAKDGSKPRKCLITREEWEEMKKTAAE